jgi:TRAP-type C4-dicarboxylate transport system permease small subunit
MSKAHSFFAKIIELWALIGGVVLLCAVLVAVINASGFSANVVARNFGLNVSGLPGYEDMVTLFVGFSALAMFPYCQLKGGNIAVDVFIKSAPISVQWASHIFSSLAVVAIALFFVYMLSLGIAEVKSDHTETAVLGWPVWPFMAPSVISCALWVIASVMNINQLPKTA